MRCFSQPLNIPNTLDSINIPTCAISQNRLHSHHCHGPKQRSINCQQPQYSQQGYQQSVVTNEYGNVQYQPYPAQPLGQQNSTQQLNQILTQPPMNTQPPPSNVSTPLQQQWTHQYYQQPPEAQPPTMANAFYSQVQLGQPTPSGQGQTGSNTTTRTTQTTTTKKSSKQSEPQLSNVTSTVTNFSKLMQQPQQQQQQQSQTQITNQHSKMMQTLPSAPPLPIQTQSNTSFSHLMQTAPPQQQQPRVQVTNQHAQITQISPQPPPTPIQTQSTTSFSHLMQEAPLPQPVVPTAQPPPPPQPTVATAQPPPKPPAKPSNHSEEREKVSVESSNSASNKIKLPQPSATTQPALQFSNTSSSTKTTATATTNKTSTTETNTKVHGLHSHQEAAEKGTRKLRRFDQHVTARILLLRGGVCPMEYNWYAVEEGYLCGGGNHFVTHEDVEAMLTTGAAPMIQLVNGFGMDGFGLGEKLVKAPPGNGNGRGDEPTFWPNWLRLEMGCTPMPVGEEGEREAPDFGIGGLRRRGGNGRFDRMGWP